MGKSTINWVFSIAMLNYQRVFGVHIWTTQEKHADLDPIAAMYKTNKCWQTLIQNRSAAAFLCIIGGLSYSSQVFFAWHLHLGMNMQALYSNYSQYWSVFNQLLRTMIRQDSWVFLIVILQTIRHPYSQQHQWINIIVWMENILRQLEDGSLSYPIIMNLCRILPAHSMIYYLSHRIHCWDLFHNIYIRAISSHRHMVFICFYPNVIPMTHVFFSTPTLLRSPKKCAQWDEGISGPAQGEWRTRWSSDCPDEFWMTLMLQTLGPTLWLCQNSYWKWPLIVDFPIKNGDFP